MLGIVLVPVAVLGWLRFGNVPVAVADRRLPQERLLTSVPLHARIDREMVKTPPIQVNENNLVAGAEIYRDNCAACHGLHGKPSSIWRPHVSRCAFAVGKAPPWQTMIGVSDDPPGETYWKVANGIRLTGMPSYKSVLTDTEMWQVSLLLANADKPLPPAAVDILRGQPPAAQRPPR